MKHIEFPWIFSTIEEFFPLIKHHKVLEMYIGGAGPKIWHSHGWFSFLREILEVHMNRKGESIMLEFQA